MFPVQVRDSHPVWAFGGVFEPAWGWCGDTLHQKILFDAYILPLRFAHFCTLVLHYTVEFCSVGLVYSLKLVPHYGAPR